jgi:hypothetical protein
MVSERGENNPGPPAGLFAASLWREKQPNQATAVGQIHSEQFLATRLIILQRVFPVGRHAGEQLFQGESPARRRDDDPPVSEAFDFDTGPFRQPGPCGDLARHSYQPVAEVPL